MLLPLKLYVYSKAIDRHVQSREENWIANHYHLHDLSPHSRWDLHWHSGGFANRISILVDIVTYMTYHLTLGWIFTDTVGASLIVSLRIKILSGKAPLCQLWSSLEWGNRSCRWQWLTIMLISLDWTCRSRDLQYT